MQASYPKTICVCHTCNTSQDDCIGAPVVDPLLTTFYEDFDTARENHRKIILYFNEMENNQVFEFDLAAFTNLDVQFHSYEYYSTALLFRYNNNANYSRSNLTFRTISVSFENYDLKAEEDTLTLGHFSSISSTNQQLSFVAHANTPIIITTKTFNADLTSLRNCKSLTVTEAVDHNFLINNFAEVKLFVNTNEIFISVGTAKITFKYKQDGVITFFGNLSTPNSNIITTFGAVDTTKVPKLVYKCLDYVTFLGTKPENIVEIRDVNNVYTNGPIFPFPIYSDSIYISFNEDTKMTGLIQKSGLKGLTVVNLTIGCHAKKRVTVKFPNVLTAMVSVISPLLNVDITHLNVAHYTRTMDDFPVVGAISETQACKINIDFIDYGPRVGILTGFWVYTDISKQFTNEELKKLPIANGIEFLTFPTKSFVQSDNDAYISLLSKTFFNKIHGFTSSINNLKTSQIDKDGKSTITIQWNKEIDVAQYPRYICIGSNCLAPNDDLTPACYYNITSKEELADLAKNNYSLDVIKAYHFSINQNMDFPLNLDTIIGSEAEIYIEGSAKNISLGGEKLTSIKKLSLKNITLNSNFSFLMPEVYVGEDVVYYKKIGIKYGKDTAVTILPSSLLTSVMQVIALAKKLIVDASDYYGFRCSFSRIDIIKSNPETDAIKIYQTPLERLTKDVVFLLNTKSHIILDDFNGMRTEAFGSNFQTIGITELTLLGDPTNLMKISPPIVINNTHTTNLIYTFPHQGDKISLLNKDHVSTSVDYIDEYKICIWQRSTVKRGCSGMRGIKQTIITDDGDVTSALETLGDELKKHPNLFLFIAVGESTTITINMSTLNERKISLWPYPGAANRLCEIKFDITEINPEYSYLYSSNLNWTTSIDEPINVTFGSVEFIAKPNILEAFRNLVTVHFHYLHCYYTFLEKFKEIHITDKIQLKNMYDWHKEYLLDGVDVYIGEGKSSNSIMASSLDNVSIRFGEGYVKLDNITFHMPKTAQNDGYFTFLKQKKIVVNLSCDDGVTFSQFPKITLDTSNSSSTELHMTGEWFGYDDNNIKLITTNKADIYIDDDMVPLTVTGAKEDVTFHVSSNVVGVYGPLYCSGGSYIIDIDEEFNPDKEIVFEIREGMQIQTRPTQPILKVNNPNIKVNINGTIVIDENFNIDKVSISLANSIDANKASSINILNRMQEEVYIDQTISVISLLSGKIDEDNIPLIKSNHTLLTFDSYDLSDIGQISLSYVIDNSIDDRAHGFYYTMNCLDVDAHPQLKSITLFTAKKPSEVPFIIDYNPNAKKVRIPGELVINSNNVAVLDNISPYLPTKVDKIIMRIHDDMDASHPFIIKKYLSSIIEINVEGTQLSKPKGYITLPKADNLILSFFNIVLLSSTKDDELQCNSVNLTNIEFKTTNSFKITSSKVGSMISDVDSLGTMLEANIIVDQYRNPITISSCNFITFTDSGWEMKELYFFPPIKVNPSKFSNLIANSSRSLELSIKSAGITSIKGLTINVNKMPGNQKVQVQFGRYWSTVKETNGLIVKVENQLVDAGMASSPVPFIFDCDKSMVNFFYNQDADGDFDTVVFDDKTMESANVTYNFTNLDPDHQILVARDLEISGDSAFSFVDNIGTVQCESVLVQENSKMTFPNVTVKKFLKIEKSATVSGQFSFDESSTLDLHWDLDGQSSLIFTPSASSVPSGVNVILDDKSVNKETFNDEFYSKKSFQLVKGDFDCSKLESNLHFVSDDPYFSDGDKNVMMTTCRFENGTTSLILAASKKIDPSNILSAGAIAGIVIACVVVVAFIVGISIYCNMKKQYDNLLSSMPMEMDDPKSETINYIK